MIEDDEILVELYTCTIFQVRHITDLSTILATISTKDARKG